MLILFLVGVAAVAIEQFRLLDTPEAQALQQELPFPKWLADFTGLSAWPGMDPPYVPLPFVDLDAVPPNSHLWAHDQGQCLSEYLGNDVCSFDCSYCVAPDDVHTCSQLSQTFDDGPSPYTPELTLALVSPLTFFTIGVNVIRFPQIYRQTAALGHVMGSHTWSHKYLCGLTNEQIVAQVEWSVWAMNATYGHIPKWFRPPYGGIDNRVRSIVRQFGMQSVVWDYDTFDWLMVADTDPQREHELLNNLASFASDKAHQGLILEHDSAEYTVSLAKKIFAQLGPQLDVAACAGGPRYIKEFGVPE